MGKLYATQQSLSVMIVSKIALPTRMIENCDSAIRYENAEEFAEKAGISGVYSLEMTHNSAPELSGLSGNGMTITRKRRSTGKVTLADVAQLAGVGTMTVSRALRTPEQVSDKLREKIEAAVQELGYMPNLAASALASASSWTIAMVVPSLAESGCSEMFAGLQQVLQPAGYQIMLAESQHRLEQEEKLLETLLASNLAAAILLSVEHSDTVRHWLKNASIPVIEIGAVRADPIDMNIGIDNVAAMFELTQMLVQRGYQNIGLLCANQEQWIFQQHLQGWYKAMLRHHLSPNRVINAAAPPVFSTGAAQLPEFLLAWPELDALVCVSDELACGALYECQRRRIKVPDDLAIVGFGDSDVSRVCVPPLTTISVPHRKIGIEAGRALLARLNDETWENKTPIAPTFCLRDSC